MNRNKRERVTISNKKEMTNGKFVKIEGNIYINRDLVNSVVIKKRLFKQKYNIIITMKGSKNQYVINYNFSYDDAVRYIELILLPKLSFDCS